MFNKYVVLFFEILFLYEPKDFNNNYSVQKMYVIYVQENKSKTQEYNYNGKYTINTTLITTSLAHYVLTVQIH